jgi:hypothetical protein
VFPPATWNRTFREGTHNDVRTLPNRGIQVRIGHLRANRTFTEELSKTDIFTAGLYMQNFYLIQKLYQDTVYNMGLLKCCISEISG